MLRLKGDLEDQRNTKELRRIARNKQKIARDNNICQVTKQLIDEKWKFSTVNSNETVRKNVCSTDQKTQPKSAPVALYSRLVKCIISNFFVDKECAENWRNSNTIGTDFVNSVFLTDFGYCFANLLDCLGQVFVYDSFIIRGWSFGLFFWSQKSTYTRVNRYVR